MGGACLKGKSGGLKLNHQNSKVTGCEHEGLSQNGYGAIIDKTPLHRRTIGGGMGARAGMQAVWKGSLLHPQTLSNTTYVGKS
jgi:hypothetical protein